MKLKHTCLLTCALEETDIIGRFLKAQTEIGDFLSLHTGFVVEEHPFPAGKDKPVLRTAWLLRSALNDPTKIEVRFVSTRYTSVRARMVP